ncbi:hypothetical protein ABIE56_000204 [Luteibacter sp. 621]|jgi:hypothetical protein
MRSMYKCLVMGFLVLASTGTAAVQSLDLPCNPLVCSVKGP